MKKWEQLPEQMKNDKVYFYYEILKKKSATLMVKRIFDIALSLIMIILLSPALVVLAIMIKVDSKGPILFKQERVTQFGRKFKVWKFRTMVNNADKIGSQITAENDQRITKLGRKIRDARLDEVPQLFNILMGQMTFVGTRPEVPKYVACYSDEMMATLLLPAGVTSLASITFKDESQIISKGEDIDKIYINKILPEKMKYNLESLKEFSFFNDIKLMFKTVFAVLS